MKEGRAVVWSVERDARDPSLHHSHLLRIIDNFGTCMSFSRRRACSFGLLQLCRRLCSIALACDMALHWRWCPGEHNPADEPSRRKQPQGSERIPLDVARPCLEAVPRSRRVRDFLVQRRCAWLAAASAAAGLVGTAAGSQQRFCCPPAAQDGPLSCAAARRAARGRTRASRSLDRVRAERSVGGHSAAVRPPRLALRAVGGQAAERPGPGHEPGGLLGHS